METAGKTEDTHQESLSRNIKVIAIGLILAVIGSIISSSYAKETITNYAGFGMLLAGVAISILSVFATAATTVKNAVKPRNAGKR